MITDSMWNSPRHLAFFNQSSYRKQLAYGLTHSNQYKHSDSEMYKLLFSQKIAWYNILLSINEENVLLTLEHQILGKLINTISIHDAQSLKTGHDMASVFSLRLFHLFCGCWWERVCSFSSKQGAKVTCLVDQHR